VSDIDHEKGLLSLKPEKGLLGFLRDEPATMRLHYPPDSVKDLKAGDTITALLSYTKGAAEPGIRAYDAPPEIEAEARRGHHSMTGTVGKLDAGNGIFDLRTELGNLTFQFPAKDVEDLAVGEQITMQLAFVKEPGSEAAPEEDME
jgi:hypothetical protein